MHDFLMTVFWQLRGGDNFCKYNRTNIPNLILVLQQQFIWNPYIVIIWETLGFGILLLGHNIITTAAISPFTCISSPSPATQIICYACSNIRDSTLLPTIIRVLTSSHYFFVFLMSSDIFHGVTPFEETKNVAWLKSGPDLEYFERGGRHWTFCWSMVT